MLSRFRRQQGETRQGAGGFRLGRRQEGKTRQQHEGPCRRFQRVRVARPGRDPGATDTETSLGVLWRGNFGHQEVVDVLRGGIQIVVRIAVQQKLGQVRGGELEELLGLRPPQRPFLSSAHELMVCTSRSILGMGEKIWFAELDRRGVGARSERGSR